MMMWWPGNVRPQTWKDRSVCLIICSLADDRCWNVWELFPDGVAYQTEIADISIWIAEKQSKSNQIKRKPRKENYEKTGIK